MDERWQCLGQTWREEGTERNEDERSDASLKFDLEVMEGGSCHQLEVVNRCRRTDVMVLQDREDKIYEPPPAFLWTYHGPD